MLLIYEAHYLDMADALTYESCVRGYHYYQDIWEPVNGEQEGTTVDNWPFTSGNKGFPVFFLKYVYSIICTCRLENRD